MANILVFLHSNYLLHSAGVEKVVLEQQGLFCDHGYDFFAICPVSRVKLILGQHIPLRTELYIIIKNGREERRCDFSNLQKFLLQNVWHAIIIHHLKNYDHTTLFLKILKRLSQTVPVFFYIHDYATICYNHLLMKNGEYCSHKSIGPSLLKCYNCKFYIFAVLNKMFYRKLFKQIEIYRIIFPSEVVYQIWRKVYFDIETTQCMILPHQRFSANTIENKHCIEYKIKIAYVGYASPEKGWCFWKDIVKNISESLIYTPYILGRSREQIPNVIQQEVSFLKEGNDAMVNALRSNKIDIVVLWSRRPETYSYTFFESFISGVFILTSIESGNIAYMVEKFHCGKVFKSESDCLEWITNRKAVQNTLKDFFKFNTERPATLIPNDKIVEVIDDMYKTS